MGSFRAGVAWRRGVRSCRGGLGGRGVLGGQLLLRCRPAVQYGGTLGQRDLLGEDGRVDGIGVSRVHRFKRGNLVARLRHEKFPGRESLLDAHPGRSLSWRTFTRRRGCDRRGGAVGSRLIDDLRGPGPWRARHDRVGGSRRRGFRRELQEPELAPGGRPAGCELALFFRQFLDRPEGGTVPGPDLGRSFRTGLDRIDGAVGGPAVPSGRAGPGRIRLGLRDGDGFEPGFAAS